MLLAISNHNSFRVLFDKIASVYFISKYINILACEMASLWSRQATSKSALQNIKFKKPKLHRAKNLTTFV